jgi:hypothetical protein
MSLKNYYYQTFPSDLAHLFRGFDHHEHTGILALGSIWAFSNCAQLTQVPADHRPQFLACLYFTVLVDQAMHTHFGWQARRFEELTRYPKFRVGLGHPAHMNPILIFEKPIHHSYVSADAIHQIIPEAIRLFVDETTSFFRDHMPEIQAADFFSRLLGDPDFNGARQWAYAAVVDGQPAMKPASLHALLAHELSSAVSELNKKAQQDATSNGG